MEQKEDLKPAKKNIRDAILSKLKLQEEEERLNKSRRIEQKLFNLPEFQRAKTVMFYVSTKFEVDTLNMIKKAIKLGKRVAVPVVSKDKKQMLVSLISGEASELEYGPYTIKQPKEDHFNLIPPQDLDLIVVPGVAFDKGGMRLGRGKGYYDRFLESKHDQTATVGLAFDFQIIQNLPYGCHDRSVEQIISA